MQVLHEQPFLDRNGIRSLFGIAASPEDQAMATAELDQQIEQIKISPHDLSADELYKLWSAFGSKCRPSAAYVATVVLIDSKAEVKSAPPVMLRNIGVVTFERPVIEDVTPDTFNLSVAVQLTLTGSGFQTPGNLAQFGSTTVAFDSVGPTSALRDCAVIGRSRHEHAQDRAHLRDRRAARQADRRLESRSAS